MAEPLRRSPPFSASNSLDLEPQSGRLLREFFTSCAVVCARYLERTIRDQRFLIPEGGLKFD
jgi:hypothetical protein